MKIYPAKIKNKKILSSNNIREKSNKNADLQQNKVKYANLTSDYFGNISFGLKAIPICAYKEDGSYKIFKSICEATLELGCKQPYVSTALKKGFKVKDYRLVELDKISFIDDRGDMQVDEEKIKKLSSVFNKNEIYIVHESGECVKFVNLSHAQQLLKNTDLSLLINGHKSYIGNITAVKSQDIEVIDEKGNKIIDKSKLSEILKRFNHNPKGIYVVFSDGNCKKFKNQLQASHALNVSHQCISSVLNNTKNKQRMVKNCLIIKANDIEKVNENGDIEIDLDFIKKQLQKASIPYVKENYKNLLAAINRR